MCRGLEGSVSGEGVWRVVSVGGKSQCEWVAVPESVGGVAG